MNTSPISTDAGDKARFLAFAGVAALLYAFGVAVTILIYNFAR